LLDLVGVVAFEAQRDARDGSVREAILQRRVFLELDFK
jgi:hypothetical protein